jgi:hypothetical protein
MKHRYKWSYVPSTELHAGDYVMCYRHDDQWEHANARIESVHVDGPGEFVWYNQDGTIFRRVHYEALMTLRCRHVSMKYIESFGGGPEYEWQLFDWNTVARWDIPR